MILVGETTKQRRDTRRPLQVQSKLGMEVTGHLRPRIAAHGLVAEDDPGDLDFVVEPAAAMIGEAGVVVADDPGPVEA